MQGKTITASKAMIDKETTASQTSKKAVAGSDIFDEEDIVTLPTSASSSRTFQAPPQIPEPEIVQPPVQEPPKFEEEVLEPVEVPDVRHQQEMKMQFTEKKFPHLPARESQNKEPPMPKSKKIDKKKDSVYIDVEDKDPVWLKDKGDHFYKRNDYHSALNAYSKALEYDKEFLMGRLNRATTWLKVRCFENAIEDLNDIENFIMNLKEEERDTDEFYQRMMARQYLKKGAGYAWISKFDQAVESLTEAAKYKNVFNERELVEILNDIERIKIR